MSVNKIVSRKITDRKKTKIHKKVDLQGIFS